MAYTLPKAWSPGMALPDYVRAEGLERHAFTTLEAPDGTYDNPPMGSGGYLVPQYVLDEGYGQGAYVTKWAPRGTYYGKKIPNWLNRPGNRILAQTKAKNGGTNFTLQNQPNPNRIPGITNLGGGSNYSVTPTAAARVAAAVPSATPSSSVIPAAYQQYGHQAAATVLGHVRRLPPNQRKAQLKKALDTIDKSLFSRSQNIANQLVRAGMAPVQAIHHGLARAMSTGLLAEVIQTGKTGTKPAPVGQLGLGCYGCAAVMGNTRRSSMGSLGGTVPKLSLTSILTTVSGGGTPSNAPPLAPPPPAEGQCDASGVYVWSNGAWILVPAGYTCTSTYQGPGPQLQVGTWTLPMKPNTPTTYAYNAMTADQKAQLFQGIAAASANYLATHITPGMNGGAVPNLINMDLVFPNSSGGLIGSTVGLQGQGGSLSGNSPSPLPIYKFPNPNDGGKTYVVYVHAIGTPSDQQLVFTYSYNPELLDTIVNALVALVAAIITPIYDAVKPLLNDLGGLACSLLGGTAGKVGAGVAGASVGGAAGAQAGVAGANLAAQACGTAPPVLPPAPPSILPVAIIGGVALLVVAAATRPKRKRLTTAPTPATRKMTPP